MAAKKTKVKAKILFFIGGVLFFFCMFFIYMLLHECGHALAIIACGGKLITFGLTSVSSDDIFTPFARAVITASGTLLPFIIFILAFIFYKRNPKIKKRLNRAVYHSAWAVLAAYIVALPLSWALLLSIPEDDIIRFIRYSNFHPLAVSFSALAVTAAVIFFLYKKGLFSGIVKVFTVKETESSSVPEKEITGCGGGRNDAQDKLIPAQAEPSGMFAAILPDPPGTPAVIQPMSADQYGTLDLTQPRSPEASGMPVETHCAPKRKLKPVYIRLIAFSAAAVLVVSGMFASYGLNKNFDRYKPIIQSGTVDDALKTKSVSFALRAPRTKNYSFTADMEFGDFAGEITVIQYYNSADGYIVERLEERIVKNFSCQMKIYLTEGSLISIGLWVFNYAWEMESRCISAGYYLDHGTLEYYKSIYKEDGDASLQYSFKLK